MLRIFGKNSCQTSQNITAAIISLQWFLIYSPAKKPHTQVSSNFDTGNIYLKVFRFFLNHTYNHKTAKIASRACISSAHWLLSLPLGTHGNELGARLAHCSQRSLCWKLLAASVTRCEPPKHKSVSAPFN